MTSENETTVAKPATKPAGWRAQVAQLAAIVMVVFVAKGALAEPFYVPSGSMEPTLLIGDALLASKFPYGYGAASLPIRPAVRRDAQARRRRRVPLAGRPLAGLGQACGGIAG